MKTAAALLTPDRRGGRIAHLDGGWGGTRASWPLPDTRATTAPASARCEEPTPAAARGEHRSACMIQRSASQHLPAWPRWLTTRWCNPLPAIVGDTLEGRACIARGQGITTGQQARGAVGIAVTRTRRLNHRLTGRHLRLTPASAPVAGLGRRWLVKDGDRQPHRHRGEQPSHETTSAAAGGAGRSRGSQANQFHG